MVNWTRERSADCRVALECSDGGGNVLMQKSQAEPDPDGGQPRWIVNGLTVLNNKGKPVKQYEPAFSESLWLRNPAGERCHPDHVLRRAPVDSSAPSRRTAAYSRVEFSPWHVTSFDANDTALISNPATRLVLRQHICAPNRAIRRQNNAPQQLAPVHANTPAQVFLDSLGRDVISIEHNKFNDAVGILHDEKYLTFTKLDAEGKPLWIRDARGNLVMQYITPIKPTRAADEPDPTNPETVPIGTVPCYDIAGNLLFQHSMDGGDRWMITDAAGQPFYAWDMNERADQVTGVLVPEERVYHTNYDGLRRPLAQQLRINDGAMQVIERFVYGDSPDLFPARPAGEMPEAQERNLRGQVYQHYDSSGLDHQPAFRLQGQPA